VLAVRAALIAFVVAAAVALPRAHADDIGVSLAVLLDEPLSENTSRGSSPVGAPTLGVSRGSLDTTVVVELVRDRLHRAAVRAAVAAIRKARGGKALRPWMRDVLGIVARLATTRDHSARLHAEALLRVGSRVVLAHVVVHTTHGAADVAAQRTWEDWVYWRLSRHPLLADAVDRPVCEGDGATVCAPWKALDDGQAIVAIDQATKLDTLIATIDSLRRLQQKIAGRGLALTDVLDELQQLAPRLSELGVVPAPITAILDEASATIAAYEAFRLRASDLGKRLTALASAFAAYQQSASAASLEAVRRALRDVDELIARPVVGDAGFLATLDLVVSKLPGARAILADLRGRLERVAAIDPGIAEDALRRALHDVWPVDLVARVTSAFEERRLPNLTSGVLQVRRVLAELAAFPAASTLGSLTVGDAHDAQQVLEQVAAELDRFARVADALELGTEAQRSKLRAAAHTARRAANWCKLARELTIDGASTSTRLSAAQTLLGELRAADHSMPLVEMLAPVLDDLVARGKLEPRHILAAFVRLDGSELLATFRLPGDVDAACEKAEDATCWSARLLLLVREAVTVDGEHVEVHTDAVVRDLADLAGRAHQRRFSPYLHLAVGTGLLWHSWNTTDQPAPLIAEQIGVGMKLAGNDTVGLRAGLYGSGLLYRLFLDSQESEGVMFGGVLMLDLFGDLELFGSSAVLIAPKVEADDKAADWITTVGVQVPLVDYLERLAD
jgi:hypothetical protein